MKSKRITEKSYRIVRNRREKRETKNRVYTLKNTYGIVYDFACILFKTYT